VNDGRGNNGGCSRWCTKDGESGAIEDGKDDDEDDDDDDDDDDDNDDDGDDDDGGGDDDDDDDGDGNPADWRRERSTSSANTFRPFKAGDSSMVGLKSAAEPAGISTPEWPTAPVASNPTRAALSPVPRAHLVSLSSSAPDKSGLWIRAWAMMHAEHVG
jgi:hypothetical protein